MTKWKLESLLIENFRSISGKHSVPLDADIVLVHGPNGAGKTSLLSALELGATGNVAHLGAAGAEAQLVNRNYPVGRVELELRNASGSRRGQIELGPGKRPGDGALTGNERLDFLERCFLPQTVLGRLLESYSAQDRVDSALVRFVKDLAGIDELDSLVDGLHPAGHLARTRVLSPAWARLEEKVSRSLSEIERIQGEIDEAQRALDGAIRQLRETLPELPSDQAIEGTIDQARVVIRNFQSAQPELSSLESMRVRLAGVQITLAGLGESQVGDDDPTLSVQSLAARQAFEAWEVTRGAAVLSVLNEIRSRVGESPIRSGQIFEVFVETKERVQVLSAEERRVQEILAARQRDQTARQNSLTGLNAELEQHETRRSQLNVDTDVRLLLDVLSAALPLVQSELCPVCDQPFPAGHEALAAHIDQKIAGLSEEAARYQALTAQIEATHLQIATLAEQVQPPAERPNPEPMSAELVRQLNSLETEVERGLSLKREMEGSLARVADVSSLRATLAAAEESLKALYAEAGIIRGVDDVLNAASTLDAHLLNRQQEAQFRVTSSERIRTSLANLELQQRKLLSLRDELGQRRASLKGERARLAEGKKRKSAANELRMEAERVRASLISEVFDHALNESWADFFSRLVPNEPFIPRFKQHVKDSRNIEVVLQTVDPSGTPFGSPASVLSFGNANTAALSLFLALHMSAPTAVDWLIFDDPVQSMDDIHVANFAALIRQLTVRHDRQVVVAVHQRELFDYLAFELAPATPSDQLLKIELERRGDASNIEWERVTFVPESAISSA